MCSEFRRHSNVTVNEVPIRTRRELIARYSELLTLLDRRNHRDPFVFSVAGSHAQIRGIQTLRNQSLNCLRAHGRNEVSRARIEKRRVANRLAYLCPGHAQRMEIHKTPQA